MTFKLSPKLFGLSILGGLTFAAYAASSSATDKTADETKSSFGNMFEMTIKNTQRCFRANGLPDHATGTFPRRGNPNAIKAQDVNVCVPLNPQKTDNITPVKGTFGIAVNGVQFRPNTAGYWDPTARRGHSRKGDKAWSLDIHGAPGRLGLDFNNAHVGRGGLYHYHGIADNLRATSGSSLVGYAGDGFQIHYAEDAVQSGWQLKSGTRPSGPKGAYDGTYNEDYEFVGGDSTLDACNGGLKDGHYVYYITQSYPFVPRCVYGHMSSDFNRSRHR